MDNSGVTRRGDVEVWLMRVIASESEAIQSDLRKKLWIASSLTLLAMTGAAV
jgi:hypothetical protein